MAIIVNLDIMMAGGENRYHPRQPFYIKNRKS